MSSPAFTHNKIAILCSAAGLGFYTPGLSIARQLRARGFQTLVYVFENYLQQVKKEKMAQSKHAYHKDFSLALVAQRMPQDIRNSIDNNRVEELMAKWEEEQIRDFIVLSGHWVYILNSYGKKIAPQKLCADLLYVDSALSPSWQWLKKHIPDYNEGYNETWLFSKEKGRDYHLNIANLPVIAYNARDERYFIHGGGWGMGTYQNKIPELEAAGLKLDIAAYDKSEIKEENKNNRYFMVNPVWDPLGHDEAQGHSFPLFGEINGAGYREIDTRGQYHPSFEITRKSKGLISKPGGGTLVDSLTSATPLVLLEPFGKHEEKNSQLWEYLGFGIPYEKWKESGFSKDLLEKLHNNLNTARNAYPDYIKSYMDFLDTVK